VFIVYHSLKILFFSPELSESGEVGVSRPVKHPFGGVVLTSPAGTTFFGSETPSDMNEDEVIALQREEPRRGAECLPGLSMLAKQYRVVERWKRRSAQNRRRRLF